MIIKDTIQLLKLKKLNQRLISGYLTTLSLVFGVVITSCLLIQLVGFRMEMQALTSLIGKY